MTETDQVLIPFSREAEEAILGSILINPEVIISIDLDPRDFYIHKHMWIYEAMWALKKRNVTPDSVTLAEELNQRQQLTEVGGPSYFMQLVNATPTFKNVADYVGIVQDTSRRRKMITIASDLARVSYDQQSDLSAEVPLLIDALATGVSPKRGAVHISKELTGLIDEVQKRAADPNAFWGIQTGFLDFDNWLGGMQYQEVFMLAGAPGLGKSKWAAQAAFGMADTEPGVFYTMEMPTRQLLRRSVSAEGEFPTRAMKTGYMDEYWDAFYKAIEVVESKPLFISDEPMLTTDALRADLARLKALHGIRWAWVDYLHLLKDGEGKLQETERSAMISSRLKAIARSLDIALGVVNSVTKDAMDRTTPKKADMRGSGQVLHDADVICYLVPHEVADDMVTLVVTKGREVSTGSIDLIVCPTFPKFRTPTINKDGEENNNDSRREYW